MHGRTLLLWTLAAVAVVGAMPSAIANERTLQAQRAWKSLYQENRPLKALADLESLTKTGWMHTNTLAQFHAITGDLIETELLAHAYMAQDTADPPVEIDCAAYRRVPAVQAIEAFANDAVIVMLNESHHSPIQRAFSALVVSRFKSRGFTHFGAETFDEDVLKRSPHASAPTSDMGAYSTEPVFGDLVRQAIRLGYTLFAYEQRPDQSPDGLDPPASRAVREQTQAANIKKLLDGDPSVRMIIHAGGGHISKSAKEQPSPMMAYRLMMLTGIEPVSIDLLAGTPSLARKFQGALYRGVERCGKIEFPMVMVSMDGGYLSREGHDVTVFFPHADYSRGGRPDWLESMAGRRFLTIRITPDDERTLIRAFVEEEPENAVAMDQMLAPPNADRVTLALPDGRYRLEREWQDGRSLRLGSLHVGSASSQSPTRNQ